MTGEEFQRLLTAAGSAAGNFSEQQSGLRRIGIGEPHRIFRYPEDCGIPPRGFPSIAPVIVIGAASRQALGFPEFPEPREVLGDVDDREFTWAHMLALRYREAGLEPLVLADQSALSRDGRAFSWEMACEGFRVVPRRPGATLWQDICNQARAAFFCIHPAAFPLVRPLSIHLLVQELAFRMSHGKDHCVGGDAAGLVGLRPGFDGRKGWPVLLASRTVRVLAEDDTAAEDFSGSGINGVAVTDTADSYAFFCALQEQPRSVKAHTKMMAVLASDEAMRLLRLSGCPLKGIRHALAVGAVGCAIAEKAVEKGSAVSPDLCLAGGLLHDMAKGYRRHEAVGGVILESLGLRGMAHIVRDHSDLVLCDSHPVTEREIVYLADKYCYGAVFVPLARRFGQKMDIFGSNAGALAGIRRRLGHAEQLQERLCQELGVSPERIAAGVLGSQESGKK